MTGLPFSDCPHCGSPRFIRRSGLDTKGRQRFFCKDCHGTWTAETWEQHREKPARIQAAIDAFESGAGIEDAARAYGLSRPVFLRALRKAVSQRGRGKCAG